VAKAQDDFERASRWRKQSFVGKARIAGDPSRYLRASARACHQSSRHSVTNNHDTVPDQERDWPSLFCFLKGHSSLQFADASPREETVSGYALSIW
jgi:hypothetical protein